MQKTDIEIAQSCTLERIEAVAARAGISAEALEPYGKYKAKIDLSALPFSQKADGHLVLVTAITPTPAGEGKTTTTIGLADALRRLGKNAVVALREPSLGPVFGLKGGAAGGGYAQIVPMEDINLHFTGDFHAIGAANNLLAAMLDNHIHQGNALGVDPRRITWRRCVDMNDRQLRFLVDGLGGRANGVPREDSFDITVASETMAALCLSDSLSDLKKRLGRMIVAYTYDGHPVLCRQLHAQGAMAALLRDAVKPNLVQTLEGTPAIVHGGPFANIAHGCNSVIATRLALHLGDYAITEAGFGADLGAEKFFDIKCRSAGLVPSAVVLVATVRALKMHGGVAKETLAQPDVAALRRGLPNLHRHIRTVTQVYGLPCVVAVNRFRGDTEQELAEVIASCENHGVKAVVSEAWAKGGAGALALAEAVRDLCAQESGSFRFAYETDAPYEEKIRAVVQKVYGGRDVSFTPQALQKLRDYEKGGYDGYPVCIAKTQYSFSDDPHRLCAPEDFLITVRGVSMSAGAGFLVAMTGEILTMPGLPKHPAAEGIDVDESGKITGLF